MYAKVKFHFYVQIQIGKKSDHLTWDMGGGGCGKHGANPPPKPHHFQKKEERLKNIL